MIADAVLNFFHAIVNGLWSLRPSWSVTLPPGVGSLISNCSTLNWVAPFSELGVVVGISAGLFVALITVKALFKVISWIPTIGGGG